MTLDAKLLRLGEVITYFYQKVEETESKLAPSTPLEVTKKRQVEFRGLSTTLRNQRPIFPRKLRKNLKIGIIIVGCKFVGSYDQSWRNSRQHGKPANLVEDSLFSRKDEKGC